MQTRDIHMRDPFVLPFPAAGCYYLYGTTDKNCWGGPCEGFDCFRSRDLESWEGPIPAFRRPPGFWASMNYWAPEVHAYRGRCYMFASFKERDGYRGTQVLAADGPVGPFLPIAEAPVTPADWECLDGTLHIDEHGDPWIVFCQEWVQVHNGAIWAMRLSDDLTRAADRPVFLFNASEAPWVVELKMPGLPPSFSRYVTDGPFLHRTARGDLLMLWSSIGAGGYTMGVARSASGRVAGPWKHEPEPLWSRDGGHGMVFRTFDGKLLVSLHTPNGPPNERPLFLPVEEREGMLRVRE
jgi:arabinan endo-1,5-alpha-L-arabinosidase